MIQHWSPSAFESAERAGRSQELQDELETLFNSQNTSPGNGTTIPATYLAVTVKVS
jgi:hypothetical protein